MLPWEPLLQWPEEQLATMDIAAVNLACANGLPGADAIDSRACLDTLDEMAQQVKRRTASLYTKFEAKPEAFNNSKAVFRMMALKETLQREFGIGYNKAVAESGDFFRDPQSLFVQGVVQTRKGTCANLAVFYVAVGRRLGYPLKLVSAKSHLFARWEHPDGERFNIECTGDGFSSDPDDYYLHWPFPTTQKEADENQLLKSKTPREELAFFLEHRGHCLHDHDRWSEAAEAYGAAVEMQPDNLWNRSTFLVLLRDWRKSLEKVQPTKFPTMSVQFPPRRFKEIPPEYEREVLELKLINQLWQDPELVERWWKFPHYGYHPPDFPRQITATFPNGDWKTINITFHLNA